MNVPLSIRNAAPHDAEAITELLRQLGNPNDSTDVRSRIESIQAPDDAIFVAELDSTVVGVATLHRIPLFHTAGYVGRITSFVVHEDFHRRGIGRELLDRIDRWGQETGCERLEVTSSDHRTGAHSFYQAAGYELDQRRFIRIVKEL